MKSVLITLFLFAAFLPALVDATPVSGRYLRFDGYASSDNGQINILEIEAYSAGVNVARSATVTANSASNSTALLIDGNTAGTRFSTNRNSPGQPSTSSPHRIDLDFGEVKSIDEVRIYLQGGWTVSFGLFLSSDGGNWSMIGNYSNASETIVNNLSNVSAADFAPLPVIVSATMRPGTTLMDVVYRVYDSGPVKVRALAFVDGVRSFANVIRPVTFVEGTAAKLGDAIPANVDHTLTWDVAADWDIDLGQIKFEVLAMDDRGLLPFDWITIPAAGGNPAVCISKNTPTAQQNLDGLFWLFADGDPSLLLAGGTLTATSQAGVFSGLKLAVGSSTKSYSSPFLFKKMNLAVAEPLEVAIATTARAGQGSGWLASNRSYEGLTAIAHWGWDDTNGRHSNIPAGTIEVVMIAAGGSNWSLALNEVGEITAWGDQNQVTNFSNKSGDLSNVTAISAGNNHALALRSDGTVVGWGGATTTVRNPPTGLSGVIAIAAGNNHSLALKNDGTVVGWGENGAGQITIPAELTGVSAVAAGNGFSLALKNDGTVVKWGGAAGGTVPAGLTGVASIATGSQSYHSLALKSDGTVVAWGQNINGQIDIPSGLNGVVAVSAGAGHSMALKSDGTVVCWGNNADGRATPPAGLGGVTAISGGNRFSLALKAKAP
jgi:transposase